MQPTFQSNMEYRQYLINNADNIIENNQLSANINCSQSLTQNDNTYMSSSPIIFHSIINPPLPYDSNSDLKLNYLNRLLFISNMSSPEIRYT